MQRETRRFLTGETSEELELGIDSEVYLMGGRMRLSPSLSLKESRDHGFPQRAFHIGLSGEAALNFTDNLLFSCKFTQDLTGLGGDTIGLSIPLFRGATIQGHVTLEAGGSLPPGPGSIGIKAVSCALPAGDLYESRSFIEKGGSFTLTGICPGPTRVSIELPAVLQEDYEIAKGQVDLNPRPGQTLTGISLILRKKAKRGFPP